MVRWCWVNFQCRGVLLIWIKVGQGPTALAVGAGEGYSDIFLSSIISLFLFPSLWKKARYKLKYYLKGPLSPNQPTVDSVRLNKYSNYDADLYDKVGDIGQNHWIMK